jgi:hypothetical protein
MARPVEPGSMAISPRTRTMIPIVHGIAIWVRKPMMQDDSEDNHDLS